MKFNPDIHRRRSIRLREYDYSSTGYYFVTVCVQDRLPLLGVIHAGQMQCSEAGEMVHRWWHKLPEQFSGVELDEFIIMPNHIHGIIRIVGADPCVRPDNENISPPQGAHAGAPLHRMIQWFKTMTTNAYIHGVTEHHWPVFNRRLWQSNYYERVLRHQNELDDTQAYIRNNPLQWEQDEMNPRMPTPDSPLARLK